jgi:hypothetical protein
MRSRVFTLPVFGRLSALTAAQSVAMMMLQAAHVVVLKKERRLELLSEGKLIKTYKVALGSDPIGPIIRLGREITRHRRVPTSLTRAILTASSTSRFTFPVPVRAIVHKRTRAVFRQEATSMSTDCRTVIATSEPRLIEPAFCWAQTLRSGLDFARATTGWCTLDHGRDSILVRVRALATRLLIVFNEHYWTSHFR